MTETIRNPVILSLFTIATEDMSALQYPLPDRLFGFCAQQSCEKLLKAWLSAHNRRYPLTHELLLLVDLLETDYLEQLPSFPFALAKLQPFSVEQRYESSIHFTDSDRAAIRETVSILREFTLSRIIALQQP